MRRRAILLVATCLLLTGVPAVAAAGGGASATPADVDPSTPGATAPTAADASALTNSTTNSTNATTVTVVSYNDVQTAAAENGSFPRMIGLINDRREAHSNPTFVVGGGDEVSPHSLAPISEWRTPVKALNVLDPDAEAIGNHDLDFGFRAVSNFSAQSEFPWVMANVVQTGTNDTIPGTKPYVIVERQGVRVGVVGLADQAIDSKTAVDFTAEGYTIKDYNAVGQRYATMLKQDENVDIVVAAAHIGIPEAKDLANNTSNIDVVVVGDDEVLYAPQETGGAVVMEAGGNAEAIAELNLTVENGTVTGYDGRLIEVTENHSKNTTAARIITSDRGQVLSQVVGETTTPLDATSASSYHEETGMGNLVTDAFRWKTGADVALQNAGGIRSDRVYSPGNVTAGDVYNVLAFGNTLVEVELTGAELKQLLASQVEPVETSRYGEEPKLQVSGVTYEYYGSTAVPDDQRIRDVWVDGQPLNESATYNVTVNSYMAGWTGSVLENATRLEQTQATAGSVLVDYLQANSPVSPAPEGRIRRVDGHLGTATLTLNGDSTTTATVQLPSLVGSVEPDSFYAMAGGETRVNATNASVNGSTVRVTFEESAVANLSGDVNLYGAYTDTRISGQRTYFNDSVLNAELSVTGNATTVPFGATDPDGDGVYEDVNGDGTVDLIDVSVLYNNRNDASVQANGTAFDFDGSGSFDLVDVSVFYNTVA